MREGTFWAHFRANFWVNGLCTIMVLAGLGAGAIGTAIDFDCWTSTATTLLAKVNYGGGSIIFGICTLCFAASASRLWRERRILFGLLAFLILIGFSTISMVGIIGSNTKERLVPYEQGQARLASEQEATRQTNALHKDYVDKQLAYLQERGRVATGPQSKQAAYSSANEAFGSIEIKPEPVLSTREDPIAQAIHSLHPDWPIATIILVTGVAWGVALKLAEMFLVGFGVGQWQTRARISGASPVQAVAEPDDGTGGLPALPSAEIIHPPQFAREPEPIVLAAPTQLDLDVDEHMTSRELVREFWKMETRPSPGARLGASVVYRAYLSWCEENDYSGVTQQLFGRISGQFVPRHQAANYTYLDRALLRQDDETGQIDSLQVA